MNYDEQAPEACRNCRFLQPLNGDCGLCRRFPPQTFIEISSSMNDNGDSYSLSSVSSEVKSSQPVVEHDDWCGEWRSK